MDGGAPGAGGLPVRRTEGPAGPVQGAAADAEAMLEAVRGLPDAASLDDDLALATIRAAVRTAHARTALAKVSLALADHTASAGADADPGEERRGP